MDIGEEEVAMTETGKVEVLDVSFSCSETKKRLLLATKFEKIARPPRERHQREAVMWVGSEEDWLGIVT